MNKRSNLNAGRLAAGLRDRVVTLTLAAVAAVGCGNNPTGGTATTHPIQGGTNDTKHLFAVGILANAGGGTALCSGALIAPNLVATARHCVAAVPADGVIDCPSTKFGALTSAKNIVVTTDADLRAATTSVAVSKVIVPSGADQTAVCGNDIALLILAQNISLPDYVTPVISPPMSDHTRYSATVTAIGYGITSANDTSGSSAGVRRIRQGIALTCIPEDPTFPNCYPSRTLPITAAEFSSGNGTCEGDSGSDAYEQDNFDSGKWFGFGVLSRGASSGSTCVGGIYTRFDAWSSLLIDAAKQASAAGGYDLPAWAGAGGGGADASTGTMDAGVDGRDASADGAGAGGSAGSDGGAPRDAGGTTDGSTDATVDGGRDAGSGSAGVDGAAPGPDGGSSDATPMDAGGTVDGGTSDGGASPTDASSSQDARAEAGAGADATGSDAGGASDAAGASDALALDANDSKPGDAGGDRGGDAGTDSGRSDGGGTVPSESVVGSPSLLGCNCATTGASARGASPWAPMILLGP
ncbi:MAG TPA: trypsin-like serine protease, partial [Polyangia bacterium]